MKRLAILAGSIALLAGSPASPAAGDATTAWAQPKHNCDFCHNLHGGSYAALRDTAVVEDMCDSCHGVTEAEPDSILRDGTWVTIPKNGGAGFAIHNGAKHTAFSRAPTVCWDCHNHEGETEGNLSMIQATMPTPASGLLPVVFTSRGSDAGEATLNSFADGDQNNDGDYTGVCEVCHTETSNHQNGLNLPDASNHGHEVGRTCPDCHKHDEGFKGGGPCASCHDTGGQGTAGDNNRRAIIPELSRPSHHVGASYADTDCTTCHDQTKHQQGNVRLWNVDSPGDTLASIVLAGDPTASSTEAAKLTTFCLACHDSSGADGNLTPFSDGLTRPLVDSTAWLSASHNSTGSLSCFGDGDFGCHGSAHGSARRKLLAPADSAPTAPANIEEEEGFCFRCHSSAGVASTDIETQFSGTIRWAPDAAGENNNANLNDRHDVQHAAANVSGAKVECYDCHDPHTATAANPLKADPDPDDGRVPGTGQVMSGVDYMTEWCLDCHDGSFPASVVNQTTPIVDIRSSYVVSEQHGAQTSGATHKSGYGWVQDMTVECLDCHAPHNGARSNQNLFQLKDILYSADGLTPIPSDGVDTTYALIDNAVVSKGKDITTFFDYKQGYYWCNTCHTGSMGSGKSNCFACHNHTSSNF